jgi:hypothetical protein
MSENLTGHVSVGDIEAIRSLAMGVVGEEYLDAAIDGYNGRFTIYDNVPRHIEPSNNTGFTERFYSVISREEEGESSMGIYVREVELSKPSVLPARLEAFRFKWSESRVSVALALVTLIKSSQYIDIPGDTEVFYMRAPEARVDQHPLTSRDMDDLWDRLCDMATVGYNKQAA